MDISEISELTPAASFSLNPLLVTGPLHPLSHNSLHPSHHIPPCRDKPDGSLYDNHIDTLDVMSPIREAPVSPVPTHRRILRHDEGGHITPPRFAQTHHHNRFSATPQPAKSPKSVHFAKPRWTTKDFDFGRKIGEGRFGKIYLARVKLTGHVVALKVMSKDFIVAQDLVLQLKREINVQQHCRHCNVLRLFAWFWDDTRVYLVLEYASGGTLGDIVGVRTCPEPEAAKYVADIAMALRYLHHRNVAHRDLKLENLLLTSEGRVKVADFTWAVYCGSVQTKRTTLCGTLDYLAPEMVSSTQPEYDTSVDMWSLGVVLFELLSGRAPFECSEPKDTVKRIQDASVDMPQGISPPCEDLLRLLLNRDRAKRLSAKEVLHHPWIVGHASDVLKAGSSFGVVQSGPLEKENRQLEF